MQWKEEQRRKLIAAAYDNASPVLRRYIDAYSAKRAARLSLQSAKAEKAQKPAATAMNTPTCIVSVKHGN